MRLEVKRVTVREAGTPMAIAAKTSKSVSRIAMPRQQQRHKSEKAGALREET